MGTRARSLSAALVCGFLPVPAVQAQHGVESWQVRGEPVFSSADWPQAAFSVIGWPDGGYMLTRDEFVVADGLAQTVHFVNLADGSSSVVAAERFEWSPAVGGSISLVDRWSDGRVVVSGSRPYLYVLSSDGRLLDSLSHDWPGQVAGVFEDGARITRGGGFGPADMHTRPLAQWFLETAGDSRPIAEAVRGPSAWITAEHGDNSVSGQVRWIFGHQVLAVRAEDRLVVNQTDQNTIRAYDRHGSLAHALVLPTTRLPATGQRVDAQRRRRVASDRRTGAAAKNVASYAAAMAAMNKDFAPFNADSIQVMLVPAADSTPHTDKMLADGSGRVWVREFRMPDDTVQRWHVWRPDDGESRKLVTIPGDEVLLDAYGNRCLLFAPDETGSGRLVMRRMELADNGAERDPQVPTRTLGAGDHVVYDSDEVAPEGRLTIGMLTGAVILPDGKLVVGDKTELYFVDHEAGHVSVVGGAGLGPGEFGHVGKLLRTPGGVAAWDLGAWRLTSYSPSGELLWSRSFDPTAFRHWMAPPVAVLRDRAVLFRDGMGGFATTGVAWDSARYVVIRDGDQQPFATASGDEFYAHRFGGTEIAASEYVLFGDRTYEAPTAHGLVVVETARSAVTIFDETGTPAGKQGLPDKVVVSRQEAEAAREEMAARGRRRFELASRAMAQRGSAGPTARDVSRAVAEVPARSRAPAVDRALVDADGRLWLRMRPRLGAETVRWQVRDMERDRMLFVVEQRGADRVWDAQGDLVLTSAEDDLGVQRVRLRRLVEHFRASRVQPP